MVLSKGAVPTRQIALTCSDHDFAASARRRFEAIPPRLPNVGATFEQRQKNVTPLLDITLKSWNQSYLSRRAARFAVENAVAPFIKPVASNRSFINTQSRLANDPLVQKAIYGVTLSERDDPAACARLADLAPGVPPIGLLAAAQQDQAPLSSMRVPAIKRLIVDSAKLARLDDLLHKLKDGGHRVLLYFQMTKMMDLVEEYLIYRQYKYLRLDGSSPISERRDMVSSWQTKWVLTEEV
jgi:DNA helicase INO80